MARRIAIIPARGGSKRIPNKNIRDFCGKPMIIHSLQTARESGLFDTIHVSTDSIVIREVVESHGYKVDFMRPPGLADDHTPIMPVLKYVAETYFSMGRDFDQVWLVMACAPLVECVDLRNAAALFDQVGADSAVMAISEYPVPIEWAYTFSPNAKLTPVSSGMFAVRSQDIVKKYFDAGVFTIFPKTKVLNSEGAGTDAGFIGYEMLRYKAIDIDTENDWRFAERMYQLKM